jgi:alpha-beta hydrolase superfamily lysophospholipase
MSSTIRLARDQLGAAQLRESAKPSRQARIPKTLPIYIFNGSRDPVSDKIEQLLDAYRAAGLTQVIHQTYADDLSRSGFSVGRDLVTRDLIAWLDGVIDRGRRAPAAVTG